MRCGSDIGPEAATTLPSSDPDRLIALSTRRATIATVFSWHRSQPTRSPGSFWMESSIQQSGHSGLNGLRRHGRQNRLRTMTQANVSIRVNGQDEALTVSTLAASLE